MAINAGTLAVSVVANTAKFAAGMSTGSKQLDAFRKHVGRATQFVGKLAAGLTTIGVVAIGAFTRDLLQTQDELAKTARALGVATESFQGFVFAGKLSGVTLRELKTALTRMNVNVSDAADGMGEAKEAFKILNLDAAKLQQLAPDEMFRRIGEAIRLVKNEARRTQLLTDIFGRSGAGLANLFQDLKQAEKTFNALGLAFSEADQATMEAFNDAVTTLKEVVKISGARFVIALAPGVESAIEALTEIVEGFRLLRQTGISDLEAQAAVQAATPSGVQGFMQDVQQRREQRSFLRRLFSPQVEGSFIPDDASPAAGPGIRTAIMQAMFGVRPDVQAIERNTKPLESIDSTLKEIRANTSGTAQPTQTDRI